MNHKKINTKSVFVSLLVTVAAVCLVLDGLDGCTGCNGGQRDTLSVRIDSVRDTVIVEVHDTLPVVKNERVVEYIKVPVSNLSACLDENVDNKHDSTGLNGQWSMVNGQSDSINMQIVQRQYSDDSTYTAYVSGVRYGHWPKLDSIIVRQREITNTITKTVTIQKRHSRWSVGLQAGYGYGFQYRGFEPYVGIGIGYTLFPP